MINRTMSVLRVQIQKPAWLKISRLQYTMKSIISNIAITAFLLHALLGCVVHAHACVDCHCSHGPLLDSQVQVQDDCNHSRHHNVPSDPNNSNCPHQSRCTFDGVVKVELFKHRWLDCATVAVHSIEPLQQRADSSDFATHCPDLFSGLRTHLAKSVLLI
jgi:hypothetical protein